MAYEENVEAKRTFWVAKCPDCGDSVSVEQAEKRKEHWCLTCEKWVPFVEVSYSGPKLVRGSNA